MSKFAAAFLLSLAAAAAHGEPVESAHPGVRLVLPPGKARAGDTSPSGNYETPASLACVYGLTEFVSGCNPQTLTQVATGGSRAIAVVVAYDDPNAAADLGVFSAQFGLPAVTQSNFVVAYSGGKRPRQDPSGAWPLLAALDIEMAHALAPNAQIILVEAASGKAANLAAANKMAAGLVAAAGGGEVADGWFLQEYVTEETTEADFATPGVVFFASTGDTAGTAWPSVLSNVVAVGGATINRGKDGTYRFQSTWTDTGGGSSVYVKRPDYQARIAKIVGAQRGVPDMAIVANPNSGVWMFDSVPYEGNVLGWVVAGGTSIGAPAAAAIVNNAGHFYASTEAELTQVYRARRKDHAFQDISGGHCSANGQVIAAVKGWDFCSGFGGPLGTADK